MSIWLSSFSAGSLAQTVQTSGFDPAAYAANALRDRNSLAGALELTLVSPVISASDVETACARAAQHALAAVSVNPCWISLAHSALAGSGICVGSVVGFPLGASLTHSKCDEAECALRLGARELETVMNPGTLKSRDFAGIRCDLTAIASLAHDGGALLTVTLEMSLLTLEEKLRAAELCLSSGADFLKTGTGLFQANTSVRDVSLLRGVVGGECGVKSSDGANTVDDVRQLLEAGASRICTASATDIVEETCSWPKVEDEAGLRS